MTDQEVSTTSTQRRATIKTPDGTIRDPEQAFNQAILEGRLSTSPHDTTYAGRFMYMHHDHAGVAHFKNIDTRQYLRSNASGCDKELAQ